MSGYQASRCITICRVASCKTLSLANESNNILEESDNWKAEEPIANVVNFCT